MRRALDWAPGWMVGQAETWNLLALPGAQAMPLSARQAIERRLLAPDLPQPLRAGHIAGADLGAPALERLLLDHHPRSLASLAPWLRVHGSLAGWLAARSAALGDQAAQFPPAQALAWQQAGLPGTVSLAVTARGRQAQAAQLLEADLPVPHELSAALSADGPPWSWWAAPIDPFADSMREPLRQLADADQGWARPWSDRAEAAAHILAGDTAGLTVRSDPLVIDGALRAFAYGRAQGATAGEVDRIRLLLGPRAAADLEPFVMPGATLGLGAHQMSARRPWWVGLAGWMGLCVDGSWVGWRRGEYDLRQLLPSGLHRVAVLDL